MIVVNGKEMRKDEISVTEAFSDMIMAAVVLRYVVGTLLYRGNYCLPFVEKELTVKQSWTLYMLFALLNAFAVLIVLNIERTTVACLNFSMIPIALSMVLYYIQSYPISVLLFDLLTIILMISPLISYLKKCKYARQKRKRLKKLKVFRRLFDEPLRRFSHLATGIVVYSIVGVLFIPSFDGYRVKMASVNADTYDSVSGDNELFSLLDENKGALYTLKNSEYENASEIDRLNALQTLLNVECTFLHISPVSLKCKKLPSYKAGYYSSPDRTAYIMEEYIKDSDKLDVSDAIETVLHEGRHAFQHDSVNYAIRNDLDLSLSVYSDIREWKGNIENYYEIESEEESISQYMTYRTQPIESDANAFGYDYAQIISSYINSWE